MNKVKQYVYVIIEHSSEGEPDRIIGVYSTRTLAMRVKDKLSTYENFTIKLHSLLKFPVQGIEVVLDLKYRKARMIKIHD